MPNRIATLTSLRFFAAAAIVMHHLPGLLWFPPNAFAPLPLHQGVSFFFVLSGFILQHAYRESVDGASYPRFLAMRFSRLWPCHIAVIALVVLAGGQDLVDFIDATYSKAQIFASLFLFQAWSPDAMGLFALNGPAWALSAELFYYALFPFLSRQAYRFPYRPAVAGALITFSWLAGLWLFKPDADIIVLSVNNPLARIFEFTIGITAYEAVVRHRIRFINTFHEACAILLVIAFVGFLSPAVASFAGARGHIVLSNWLIASFSSAAFVALIVVFSLQRGVLSRFLASAPIVYLGDISFALFLVHQPVIFYLNRHHAWFSSHPVIWQVVLFIIILLGLSAVLHHFVENPCTSVVKRFVQRRREAVSDTDS